MQLDKPCRQSYRVGPYRMDGQAGMVFTSDDVPVLSGVGFEVLYQLVENKGAVVKRNEFRAFTHHEGTASC